MLSELQKKELQVNQIEKFLEELKDILLKMNISLDTHEINKCLANSLNRALLKEAVELENIYTMMMTNYDEVTKNVPIIEDQIRAFNKSQDYKYYVDMEDVFYLVFYKQIVYVEQILTDTIVYLNSNVNLIFIYTYIIHSFYDEPAIYTDNYIFILTKKLESEVTDDKMKDFFSKEKIMKLKIILELIYKADNKFIDLIKTLSTTKNNFIERDIEENSPQNSPTSSSGPAPPATTLPPASASKSSAPAPAPSNTFSTKDIEEVEKQFKQQKIDLLNKKREVNIALFLDTENINDLLGNNAPVSKELWFGMMLFLYKKFSFNFDEYKTKVTGQLQTLNMPPIYIPGLDPFKDLDLPDSVYVNSQKGGAAQSDHDKYYSKYLKYKTKTIRQRELNRQHNIK